VLALAAYPHAHLMFSGQYALSQDEPPYRDLFEVTRRFASAFGAERMLWASDFPWTIDVPGYPALLRVLDRTLPDLTPAERAQIMGGTVTRLLPTLTA